MNFNICIILYAQRTVCTIPQTVEKRKMFFIGIQPPTLGPGDALPSEGFIPAILTTLTSLSSRKDNRLSDSSKVDTTSVHQAETLATGGGTVGDKTTPAGVGGIATTSEGSVVNKHDNKQLQSFRKPGSSIDTSGDQQELTTPSVLRSSAVDVPESPHETVTDQTTSRDHTTSVEQFCCGNPPEVGQAVVADGKGRSRNYRCVTGYRSRTNITTVCSADCQWTKPSGSCLKVCGELSQLYGAEPLPGDNLAGTTRLYKCSEGFFSDQIIKTTCLDTGKWMLPTNRYSCTVTCVEPPDLENAVLVSKGSAEITYKCKEGFAPTTPILLECLPTGTWTTPTESCITTGCSKAPRYVMHASTTSGNSTYQSYKCAKRYQETGPIYSICVDGKWTKPTEKCTAAGCSKAPRYVMHASTTSGNSTYQSYKCAKNYQETGPIYSICVDGKWTKPTEKCTAAGCSKAPRYVMHASTTSGNSTYQSYKCAMRYQETGPIYSICVGDKWTKPTEKCTAAGCSKAPRYVMHASTTSGNSTYQSYKCAKNYQETGPIYSICVGDKWTKPTEKCTAAGCSKAPRYVMHASTTSGNSTYQSYKCAKNYQETGPIYSICVDGKWTKPTEKCTAHCGPAPDVQNAIRERATATRQYYKCKPGYFQTGKLYAMCSGGKKWVSPTSGSCDAFGATEQMNAVDDDRVNQASGLAASWRHKGYLYTHNDYHAVPEVYVLEAATSHVVATIHIQNAVNNDWEDIAVGPCGEDSCIYVGDIGGHEHGVDDVEVANIIYRVKEPEKLEYTIVDADVLRFNGAFDDASVLLVDPEETLYVVSSDEDENYLHLLPNNWGGDTVKDAEVLHPLKGKDSPLHTFWSGDISPDGSILVLLQNNFIYYWDVGEGGIKDATTKSASASPIEITQPQGATFKVDMSGLYIITEDTDLPMYFVKTALHGQTWSDLG